MTLDNFLKGLQILRPHYDKPDGYHLGAEHDQIYIYATNTQVSADDVAELLNLGFFQPDVRYKGEEPTVADYDSTVGWSVFV
jgi:hypothetical protein